MHAINQVATLEIGHVLLGSNDAPNNAEEIMMRMAPKASFKARPTSAAAARLQRHRHRSRLTRGT